MASRWLPIILALEIESAGWQANSLVGYTQADPRDEHCQSSVGSASDPWRSAQARRRYRTDQRGHVHGQATKPAVPRLEDILRNHADGIAAMDMFIVPTISFRLLYGLLIMGHDGLASRRIQPQNGSQIRPRKHAGGKRLPA